MIGDVAAAEIVRAISIQQSYLQQKLRVVLSKKPVQDSMKASENQNLGGFKYQPSTFTGQRGGATKDTKEI